MNATVGRDLDLNLLRVFVVVAESGSVTAAAARLYLTQPAISAALKRLTAAVGAPLFARQGRGIVLTARGRRLLATARPHLEALVRAALSDEAFDPRTCDRTVRIGVSDSNETWLVPRLLHALAAEAQRMKLVVLPVQFRTVADVLSSGSVDLAVTVADEVPAGVHRRTLYHGGFVCLFDPRHLRARTLTLERYLAQEHVVVSYNADLRGIVEDALGIERRVRVSLPSFHAVGAVVDGSALVATIPERIAREIVALRPHLRIAPVPLATGTGEMELLVRAAVEDDPAIRFVADLVARIATDAPGAAARRGRIREPRA